MLFIFFFQAEDGIRDHCVTGVQTCALPILGAGLGILSSSAAFQAPYVAWSWRASRCSWEPALCQRSSPWTSTAVSPSWCALEPPLGVLDGKLPRVCVVGSVGALAGHA